MPSRRKFLIGAGTVFAGASVLLGTDAFSSVTAERTVSVNTAGDADALLTIEPGAEGDEYVIENGTIEIDVTGTNAGGQGVNQNAVTAIDQLLKVTNNGTSNVVVGFDNEYAIDEDDYDDAPGGWGYAVNDDEDAAVVVWASPLPADLADKTLSGIRPDLVSTGFTGSTLVDGRIDDEIDEEDERTISPGESLNVGIVIDTRDKTVEDEPLPSQLDDVVSLYAEATGSGGGGRPGGGGGSGGTPSDLVGRIENDEDITLQQDYDLSSLGYSGTATEYDGTLDGNGQAIRNIDIDGQGTGPETGFIDALASGGEIKNLTVEDSTIKGDDRTGFIGFSEGDLTNVSLQNVTVEGESTVGTLVGENDSGTISNASASGSVTQTGGGSFFNGGGLVGENRSTISVSDTTADVSAPGGNNAGGLAGYNNGTIEDSSASGTVEGDDVVGGFVGQNSPSPGLISGSSAQGDVTGDYAVGGFAGEQTGSNGATIAESYATGAVTGVDNGQSTLSAGAVGGFIGVNQPNNSISKSYATGTVDAPDSEEVGGFVGNNGGTVETSYATGGVTGDNSVGGFAGENGKLVFRTYATGGVTGTTNVGGLVGRLRGSSSRDGVLEDGYFDDSSTATGQTDAVGVVAPYGNTAEKRGEVKGLATTDMQGTDAGQNLSTFSFSSPATWTVVTNPADYPLLQALNEQDQLDARD